MSDSIAGLDFVTTLYFVPASDRCTQIDDPGSAGVVLHALSLPVNVRGKATVVDAEACTAGRMVAASTVTTIKISIRKRRTEAPLPHHYALD